MVREPIPWLVLFLFLFLYHVFIVTVQELACSTSYGVNKTLISKKTKIQTKIIKSSPSRIKYSTYRHHTANKRKDIDSKTTSVSYI